MGKAYKFRIYPNTEQTTLIEKTFGCCRFVYNEALAARQESYKTTGKSISKYLHQEAASSEGCQAVTQGGRCHRPPSLHRTYGRRLSAVLSGSEKPLQNRVPQVQEQTPYKGGVHRIF